jgi:hypothetical protein
LLEETWHSTRPFALSLSKGLHRHRPGFDKLNPNGYFRFDERYFIDWRPIADRFPTRSGGACRSLGAFCKQPFDGLRVNGLFEAGDYSGVLPSGA